MKDKKDWIIKKINRLNWVFILSFFISVVWEITESFLGNNQHFELTNLNTWRPREWLFSISTFFLLFETIALLKNKKVNVLESIKEAKDINDEKGGE